MAALYIIEVIIYIKKYEDSLEQNAAYILLIITQEENWIYMYNSADSPLQENRGKYENQTVHQGARS